MSSPLTCRTPAPATNPTNPSASMPSSPPCSAGWTPSICLTRPSSGTPSGGRSSPTSASAVQNESAGQCSSPRPRTPTSPPPGARRCGCSSTGCWSRRRSSPSPHVITSGPTLAGCGGPLRRRSAVMSTHGPTPCGCRPSWSAGPGSGRPRPVVAGARRHPARGSLRHGAAWLARPPGAIAGGVGRHHPRVPPPALTASPHGRR